MGRFGGRTPSQRRLWTTKILRQIDGCKIKHLPVDAIAEELYSRYPEYKRYKFMPFRTKVRQILHRNDAIDEHLQKIDERESSSSELEAEDLMKNMLRQGYKSELKSMSNSKPVSSSSELAEETECPVEDGKGKEGPRFKDIEDSIDEHPRKKKQKIGEREYSSSELEAEDLMKNMLRQGYKSELKSMSNSKAVSSSSVLAEETESPVEEGKSKEGPRFEDMGGIQSVLDTLMDEVIVPLSHPELLNFLQVEPVAGILLHGPPGCGKTMLAHAIANEAGVPFYHVSSTQLVSGVAGASEENLRALFSKAYRTAPSIVFIDEIDAIGSKREHLWTGTDQRIVNQLLTCMSGHKDSDLDPGSKRPGGHVLVIGATNRPDALDSALRRNGRFNLEIALGVPDENGRFEILSRQTRNQMLAGDFDMAKIASSTPGFVAADLAALGNRAGILAIKRMINQRRLELSIGDGERDEEWWRKPCSPEEMEKLRVTMSDFEEAVKVVQPSLRREGFSTSPNVKWEDVGGLDVVRGVFERSIVRQIKHAKLCKEMGVEGDTGFLLYGPPGCGKTLIAKAVATEAGASFIHIKGPELLNKYVGESELHVRTLFMRARTCAPCILFFDEVDALTTKRGKEGGHIVERLLDQLMIELDGAEKRPGVFVIGATNRPEMMDDAVKRNGRFGKMLYVPLPSPEERGSILKALARKKPVDMAVDLLSLGKSASCENFSGADLAALMNEAAMAALDEKLATLDERPECEEVTTIKYVHFEQALTKVSPSVSAKQIQYYERQSKQLSRSVK